ncbi:MAG TPA: 2,4'-dihydroxyacetophenone dioxygenase family protein [Acidimicrobiales bacterium]|jgi:hypothetical protein|nr:2,4'-dihydroxyacetophenone dioxygenase family protein [Acidimicrobiales bacterium]
MGPLQFVPSAKHVGIEDVPWVKNPLLEAEMRLLQVNEEDGLYVLHGRMPAGMSVGTHRHRGPVLGFTLSGSWGYRENDFLNRAGSYLYEPVDSVHTLFVPADNTEVTETLFAIYGDTEYLDADGNVTYVSNAARNLELYYEACEAAGVPRPNGIIH